jgi:DNA repair exonuclease SbcCD ATPase subunit
MKNGKDQKHPNEAARLRYAKAKAAVGQLESQLAHLETQFASCRPDDAATVGQLQGTTKGLLASAKAEMADAEAAWQATLTEMRKQSPAVRTRIQQVGAQIDALARSLETSLAEYDELVASQAPLGATQEHIHTPLRQALALAGPRLRRFVGLPGATRGEQTFATFAQQTCSNIEKQIEMAKAQREDRLRVQRALEVRA